MKKLNLYVDTSVWNFYFAEDSPDKQKATVEFFEEVVAEELVNIFISAAVIKEISNADTDKQRILLKLIDRFDTEMLEITKEVDILAQLYLTECALPLRSLEDATHAAVATVNNINYLVSWNLKHLANINRKKKISSINIKYGYEAIDIFTPMEVNKYGM